MLFPTVEFAIFFRVVLAVSWALMPQPSGCGSRSSSPPATSFYAAANWRFCLLLGGVTLANQVGRAC